MSDEPSIDERVQALEELRAADRILAGVVADVDPSNEEWDRQTADEIEQSEGQLNGAHHAFRRAAELLGGSERGHWKELERWGSAFSPFPDIADLIAGLVESRNHQAAKKAQEGVRSMFDAVRTSDPKLAERVDPLADWSALDVDEEHNLWKLYPWQMAVGIVAGLFALWRWLSDFLD